MVLRAAAQHRRRLIALLVVATGIAAAVLVAPRIGGESNLADDKQSDSAAIAAGQLSERFARLGSRHTNRCGLLPKSLESIATRGRLQGSCCRPMDYARYVRQVEGLKRYAAVPEIPADPYDISVRLAKRLLSYDRSIALTPEQQVIYDRAVKVSDEHGPCCCRCWRWYAFEGQAKFLIADRGYGAARIAEVWNLEDGCGGGEAA